MKHYVILFIILVLTFPSISEAYRTGNAPTREEVVAQLIDYLNKRDPQMLDLLETVNLEIRRLSDQAILSKHILNAHSLGTGPFSYDHYTQIQQLNTLAQSQNATKWKDIREALIANNLKLRHDDDSQMRHQSAEYCRQYYKKISENEQYTRCQFRFAATYVKHGNHRTNCQNDAKAISSIDATEEMIAKSTYICMRNLGWKDPKNWPNNL